MKTLWNIVRCTRPYQQTKNVFVLAALVFSGRVGDPWAVAAALAAFAVFAALSGGAYLLNDVLDRHGDRRHPAKRRRPIASGELPASVAAAAAFGLLVAGLVASAFLGRAFLGRFFVVSILYVGLNVAYSLRLRRYVVLDVMSVAMCFVLRAMGGAAAIDGVGGVRVPISPWLVLCTFLVALLMALGKRRHELASMGPNAAEHRPVLAQYGTLLLDQMMSTAAASTILSYSLYTTIGKFSEKVGGAKLGLTIPFVIYGVFRYFYLVYQKREGGDPSQLVTSDPPLMGAIALWAATVAVVIYRPDLLRLVW